MESSLDALLSAVDDHYVVAENYGLVMDYSLACLEILREKIPMPVRPFLDVARAYWERGASAEELSEARVRCWEYLDPLEKEADPEEVSISAVRALICVLYPEPPTSDLHELLSWFVSHLQRVADIDDQLVLLTRRYFPKAV